MDFKIESPIWATKSVGLDASKVEGSNTIEILYTYRGKKGLRQGARMYPDTYEMDGIEITKYPTQTLKGGIEVYLVPIADLRPAIGLNITSETTSEASVIEVKVREEIVFEVTFDGKVLVNGKERFTDKELADALWAWAKTNVEAK